ncbi:MAG: ribonuclease P protein component [Limnohabitans sp.]
MTRKTDFDAVMGAGVQTFTAHFALHLKTPTEINRIGAVVPKRWAKRAVTRNTIKRQIYAMAAHRTWPLPASDRVVRLRKAFDKRLFGSATSWALKAAVKLELQLLFDKAQYSP